MLYIIYVDVYKLLTCTMKRIGIIAAFLILFVGIIVTLADQFGKQADQMGELSTVQPTQTQTQTQVTQVPQNDDMKQPKMALDKTKKYSASIKTSLGDIEIELYADKTPVTVNNFVALAKKNFYNNVIFHRTIKGFMIQGGDPTGTGSGGPGYKFADEKFDGEYTRGTIAMANAGPNTNGSQFFIMHKDNPLPKNYVIFGKVTKGLETVDAIAEAPTKPEGEGSSPVNPVKILSVAITEK
jgi:cyclophilin family peptidyl-prolyl cis-trans isomerase